MLLLPHHPGILLIKCVIMATHGTANLRVLHCPSALGNLWSNVLLCPPPSDGPHGWRGPLSLDATNEWRQYPRCIPVHAISPRFNIPDDSLQSFNKIKSLMILVLIQGSIVPQLFGPVADHISSISGGDVRLSSGNIGVFNRGFLELRANIRKCYSRSSCF